MRQDELTYAIQQEFQKEPTNDQKQAIRTFIDFLTDTDRQSVMILRGSAGTGKTTLAGALVRAMQRLHQRVMLLAPTGRAAKVFSLYSNYPAFTIHRRIYREQKFVGAEGGVFQLNNNCFHDMLFMVDESSMIANMGLAESAFGSGCLLDDLVQYVYQGDNCRLLLIGDTAQLPPVGEVESPALNPLLLAGYGLKVFQCDVNEVLRQSAQSGILSNATMIRQMITHDEKTQLPQIHLRSFPDLSVVTGDELIETMSSSYSEVGMDETIVITRSNKRANIYNQGIRNRILDREEELSTTDLLMIVRNKYFDTKNERQSVSSTPAYIANGDRAVVKRVRNVIELYDFRFADVTLAFPDYDNFEMDDVVILDTLTSEAPALTREQSEHLFESVLEDYSDVPLKRDRIKQIKQDRYFNALQVKYAYAITCHKAQGGQWAHVYLDQGYMTEEMLTPAYIHWLYTAFTRATEHLYLVNWPKTQTVVEE